MSSGVSDPRSGSRLSAVSIVSIRSLLALCDLLPVPAGSPHTSIGPRTKSPNERLAQLTPITPDCSKPDKKDVGKAHASYNIFTIVYFTRSAWFVKPLGVFVGREDPLPVNGLTPGAAAGGTVRPMPARGSASALYRPCG